MGVLMELPTMAAVIVSKSTSLGEAELQMGTLMCTRPGNFSSRAAIDSWSVTMVFTSISFSCLLTSRTLTLLSLAFIWPSHTLTNSASSSSSCLLVTFPNSAYSPILFGGLAHIEPNDFLVLGIDLSTYLVEGGLKGRCSGLTTQVHLVTGDPSEVGDARDWIRQLLDLLKVVGHGHSLPYLRVIRHPA